MSHQAKTPATGGARGRPSFGKAVWLAVLMALAAVPVAGRAESLEGALRSRGPEVIRFLKSKDCTSIGVLKFLVRQGKGEAAEDDAGAVNLSLAQHMTTALVLCQDPTKEQEAVRVIRNANAVAAGLHGASWWSREGRRKLFEASYPLVWSEDGKPVKPDGFLTGAVEFSEDLHKVTVLLKYFNSKSDEPQEVFDKDHRIQADMDAATLAAGGLSFLDREALNDSGDFKLVPNARAADSALEVQQKKQPFPFNDKDDPVQLEIEYGGRAIELHPENGKASIEEPRNGEQVVFRLKRTSKAKGRLGVVLLVNGENTLYRERKSGDYRAYAKWILKPGADPIEIDGFQKDEGKAGEFVVRPPSKTGEDEINYGEDLGKITLIVFREKQSGEKEETDGVAAAVRQGALPGPGAETMAASQQSLKDLDAKPRGIIMEGPKVKESHITVINDFTAAPNPVMTAIITYYHPK